MISLIGVDPQMQSELVSLVDLAGAQVPLVDPASAGRFS